MGKIKVLITGATGKIGGMTIRKLLPYPELEIIACVRSSEQAASFENKGIKTVFMDLDKQETLLPALKDVDRVFLVTGYTVDMLRQSKVFVDACKKAGVQHIVHLGACGRDDTTVAHWAWHQLVESYIYSTGFSYTHLRPEGFMQNLLGYGGISPIHQGVIQQYIGDARLSWVDCEDVASVAAVSLLYPEIHNGQIYRLGYDAKSYYEVAETLTRVVGQPFSYDPRPPEEFIREILATGAEPAYMNCVYQSYIDQAAHRIEGIDDVFDNFSSIVTGQNPTTWEIFAEKHKEQFRY